MTKIYKTNDLAKAMTEKTMEYMAKGYVIDLNHNRGHQGEITKVIMGKGNEAIAVYLNKESVELFEDGWRSSYATFLRVERQVDLSSSSTYWLGEGEVVEETAFYHLEGHGSDVYTTDIDFAREVKTKQANRRMAKRTDSREFKPTKRILNVLKNHWGYKSMKLEDVDHIVRKDKEIRWGSGQTKPYYEIYFTNWKKATLTIS